MTLSHNSPVLSGAHTPQNLTRSRLGEPVFETQRNQLDIPHLLRLLSTHISKNIRNVAAMGHRPSENEANNYLSRLPSAPRLVARTGTDIWDKTGEELWATEQYLVPVGREHKIVHEWVEGGKLPEIIIACLGDMPWMGIDILRLATIEDQSQSSYRRQHPVVMLVTVEEGLVEWETAYACAWACKASLETFGITDVQVVVKESVISMLADDVMSTSDDGASTSSKSASAQGSRLIAWDPTTFEPPHWRGRDVYNGLVHPLRHLSDAVGTRLSRKPLTDIYGTKGLYLSISPTDKQTWDFEPCVAALTCRHVVICPGQDDGQVYRYAKDTCSEQQRRLINQSLPDYDLLQKAQQLLDNEANVVERLERFNMKYKSDEKCDQRRYLEVEKTHASASADVARRVGPIMEQTNQPNSTSIVMGHVLFAQELTVKCRPDNQHWLRDYALVEMHEHVLPRRALRNRLPTMYGFVVETPPLDTRKCFKVDIEPHFASFAKRQLSRDPTGQDETALLSSEIIPEAELTELISQGTVVGKYGAHGLTFGIVNEVKSILRSPYTRSRGIHKATSWEICVVSASVSDQPAFSKRSDSGSAVWDMAGRVLGMITGGWEPKNDRDTVDTTYVTGLGRIIADLEESGIKASLI